MSFADLFKDAPVEMKALSHSRMNDYFKCPRKAKYKHIDRMREPDSIHTARGSEVHKQLEAYTLGTYEVGPEATWFTDTVKGFMDVLRTLEGQTEMQVAFDKDWNSVSWFDPTVFMRVVFDFIHYDDDDKALLLVDHKTGKVYPEHDDQSDLYAVAGFNRWPGAETIDVRYLYVDQNYVASKQYSRREDYSRVYDKVMARANIITSDRIFPTNPTKLCNWCHFRRSNQGPCDHG